MCKSISFFWMRAPAPAPRRPRRHTPPHPTPRTVHEVTQSGVTQSGVTQSGVTQSGGHPERGSPRGSQFESHIYLIIIPIRAAYRLKLISLSHCEIIW